ncbi:hypothetical protein DL96DRAFT_1708546 [Flagelloscypha sp. PMI_526]|nr:hypothetical protein DL96DRAFT_1708546 [Flagelloscypha sp. PMI_526]
MSKAPLLAGVCSSDLTDLVNRFYAVSDKPGANEEYITFFNANCRVSVFQGQFNGQAEVLKWREKSWEDTLERFHEPLKIFVHSDKEIAVLGKYSMTFKDGQSQGSKFLALLSFDDDLKIVSMEAVPVQSQ